MKKKIVLKRLYHRGKWRLVFIFASGYDEDLVSVIKTIKGHNYSKTNKCWYADDDEATLKQIIQAFREKADIDISFLTHNPNIIEQELPEGEDLPPGHGPLVNSSSPYSESEEIDGEMIPERRNIEQVVNMPRYGPVEFRINEKEAELYCSSNYFIIILQGG